MKLYVIEADRGRCKIGVSENPIKRLAQLEGAGGFSAKSFFYTEFDDCAEAEKQLLNWFDKERVATSTGGKSEWVNAEFIKVLMYTLTKKWKFMFSVDAHLTLNITDCFEEWEYVALYGTADWQTIHISYDKNQIVNNLITGCYGSDSKIAIADMLTEAVTEVENSLNKLDGKEDYNRLVSTVHGAVAALKMLNPMKEAIEKLDKKVISLFDTTMRRTWDELEELENLKRAQQTLGNKP